MSQAGEIETTARGAERRRERREQRLLTETLGWWRKPGILIFLGALLLAAVGWGLLIQAAHRIPVSEATLGNLHLQFDEARWITDQMEHGDNFQKPAVMMPDLPAQGQQRVTVWMSFGNRTDRTQAFLGEEFTLMPEIGPELPPIGAVVGEATVAPGQTLNTALHFDVDTEKPRGRLLLKWHRAGRSAYFAIPEPAEHYHLRPRGKDVSLPPDARLLLPIGKAERGARLYAATYGCSACHGDPKVAGSNNIGPHLGNIGSLAAHRIAGMPASQYLYQSILEPNAFIAPECQDGKPCDKPSSMPEYETLVNLQDAADLLAYLMELRG